jgi:LysR family transcriptional regulator, cyn operon transcriptional activator
VELRQLEMLRAVVECGGYKQAGLRLHLSHPAIHRQIRLLEEEIAMPVFQRVGRRVQPTEAGRLLLALAGSMHQEVGHALSELRDLADLHSGNVRLGTATTMLMFYLPHVLRRFRKEHPRMSVQLMTGTVESIVAEIRASRLDLGIVFWPHDLTQGTADLYQELLYRQEFVLAVSEDHPLAARSRVSVADLRDVALLSYSRRSMLRRYLEVSFRGAGVEPQFIMELENEETISKMIEIGMSAAILSRPRVRKDNLRHFRIRGLDLHCPVCLIYSERCYFSRAGREFARICQESSLTHR